jgi:hypothetical protein
LDAATSYVESELTIVFKGRETKIIEKREIKIFKGENRTRVIKQSKISILILWFMAFSAKEYKRQRSG